MLGSFPCTSLKGVGDRVAEKLKKLGIHTVQDLLFHLPFRYQDRTRVVLVKDARLGDYCLVSGAVMSAQIVYGKRRSLICHIYDGTGKLAIRFFHFTQSQHQRFLAKEHIKCFGELRLGRYGLEMVHPEYEFIADDNQVEVETHLTPIYPTTEGVHQKTLRKIVSQALTLMHENGIEELLPVSLTQKYNMPTLKDAIAFLHQPPPDVSYDVLQEGRHPAQKRLAFEEILAHQLSLKIVRRKIERYQAIRCDNVDVLISQFKKTLPFELTGAQTRVLNDVLNDMKKPVPMSRLVQGDVGSGKTVVAVAAMLAVVQTGHQAALMAPTEILAEQHFKNITKWCQPLGVHVELLTGQLTGKQRTEVLEKIGSGVCHIIVGTHALFQTAVEIKQLALIVIDEQHRFGVHQRLALRKKGYKNGLFPHQLVMTATPIPRTLTMTAYADLECSVIDEYPPGRLPIKTVAVAESRRDEVIARVKENGEKGRQAYWVCTLIEESEVLQCQAAQNTAEQLKQQLPELKIGLVHGRMKSHEKESVMDAFKKGDIDLLVATTVIEVGVDVPNANLMILENPERLGLAQLHQLRGRVGRGTAESFCVLLYKAPLSDYARERIDILRNTQDGFVIAQKDLALRGPGDVLGTRQTGLMQFKIANLQRDQELIHSVSEAAHFLITSADGHVEKLMTRWLKNAKEYAAV